jgi:hypothetical protein
MSFEDIQAGSVIRYPYLWEREASRGETEGRKDRPTVVVLRLTEGRSDRLILLPVTTKPPTPGRVAVELPESERRRAGLDLLPVLRTFAARWRSVRVVPRR